MYGTVARFRIKPGSEDTLLSLSRELEDDPPAAYVAAYVFRLDSGNDEYITASVWTDRESYRRNSEDERQQRWFARVSELVVGEPQWHDGEVVHKTVVASRAG